MRASRAIIHLDNLKKNLDAVRQKIGPVPSPAHTPAPPKICFSVKADAYGHGAVPVARYALEKGADCLAIAMVSEGIELRQAGNDSKVFLLSQALPEEIDDIVNADLIPLVSDRDFINALAASAKKQLEVHLKIDTGMGRLGCNPLEAAELAALISKAKNLRLGGIATHLSVADSTEPENMAYTKKQIACFRETVDQVRRAGIDPGELHTACSGAVCFHEESYFDMVRPGLMLYGYLPIPGIPNGLVLEPVMELRSSVVHIKKAIAGEEISYGRTWKALEDTFIGVLPIGYADGLPRLLSNQYSVLIRGKSYPLVGRICMDQCMVNLGNSGEVQRWDEAIIFGSGFTNADDIARRAGTIPYEILCNINKRVPRVYLK